MGYKDLQNNIEPEEGLGPDEARVRRMLGELKRIEAPKNFEFAVQTRIANTRPEGIRAVGRGFAVLRYALPLVLVIVVVSGFVLNNIYSVKNDGVPAVAGSDILPGSPALVARNLTVSAPSAVNTLPASRAIPAPAPELAAAPVRRIERRAANSGNTGGGSYTSASEGPKPIIDVAPRPAGANTARDPGKMKPGGQIAVQSILGLVGIEGDVSDHGWKVSRVEMNGVADRSGVKVGDYVEGINGQPVTEGTHFSGVVVKSLKIRREGKSFDIDLKQ